MKLLAITRLLTPGLIAVTSAFAATAQQPSSPLVYGFMAYSDEWKDHADRMPKYGIYSFRADGSAGFTEVSPISPDNDWALDGAVLVGGKYYCYSVPDAASWMSYPLNFKVIDAETWTVEKEATFEYSYYDDNAADGDAYLIPSDLAYDDVHDIIYASARMYNSQEGSRLCTVDRMTGKLTRLGEIPPMAALTTDASGALLGIGIDGNLYSVAPEGAATLIGHTGYYPSDGLKQSAAFDFASGRIYWSAFAFASIEDRQWNRNSVFAMLEVDPATAQTKVSWVYPRDQRFSSVNIKNATAASPADITDLTFAPAAFESMEGAVTFTVPSLSATMQPITGKVDISGSVDGTEVFTRECTPGERFTATVPALTAGYHTLTIKASVNGASGNPATATAYFGPDTPAKIESVRAARVDGSYAQVTLNWTAPVLGAHGSAYDSSVIRYKVVRQPGNVVIESALAATSLTDNVTSDFGSVNYKVTPFHASRPDEPGVSTTSNTVTAGIPVAIPYTQNFDTQADFNTFTVIDVDGNGDPNVWGTPTWMYDEQYACAFYYGKNGINANDWLVTPPLALEEGRLYRLTYNFYGYYGYGNHFRVALGATNTAEALTRVIQDITHTSYAHEMPGIESSVTFAPRGGEMYIGFHHISENMEHLSIDNIRIVDVGDARIPDVPTAASAQRITSRSLSITLTAPLTDAGGNGLTKPVSVKIIRSSSNAQVALIEGVKPGETITWTDEDAIKGKNAYQLMAVNEFGDGLSIEVACDLSDSVPVAVNSCAASYINDRQVEITWEPVTSPVGENGNPVDLSEIRYLVYKPVSTEEGIDYKLIGRDIRGSRFIDGDPFLYLEPDKQQAVSYYVAPVNSAGEGYATLTNGVIVGPTYTLPFAETWRNQEPVTFPWNKFLQSQAGWYIRHKGYDPMCDGQDGYGVLTCEMDGYPDEFSEGYGGIATPRLDLSSIAEPKLSFYYYRSPQYDPSIMMKAAILLEGSNAINYFPESFHAFTEGEAGWAKAEIDLSDYAAQTRASIALVAYVKPNNHMHVDNFRIEGTPTGANLQALYIAGADRFTEGMPEVLSLGVANHGGADATDVKLALKADARTVATATIPSLSAGCATEALVTFTPDAAGDCILTLEVEGASEEATREVSVEKWNPASISTLAGEDTNAGITLTWGQPDLTEEPRTGIDAFDTYDSFAIGSFGPWTTDDRDEYLPLEFSDGAGSTLKWPNCDALQAFAVFDPDFLPNTPAPAEGSKCLVNWGSAWGANDDWLISPLLSGEAQLISFYVRAFADDKETYNVLYSTAVEPTPESFIALNGSEPLVAPSDWELKHFMLPEGARRFAVQYVASKKTALLLDSFLFSGYFNPQPVDAYEIMRDGVKIATVDANAPRSFTDSDLTNGDTHTYTVHPVICGRAVAESNPVTITANEFASISDISAAPGRISISGGKELTVSGAAGVEVEVYFTDGSEAMRFTADSDVTSVRPAPGLYIVRAGSATAKVLIR